MLDQLRSRAATAPLALLLALAGGTVVAAQVAVKVVLTVRLVPTSGACGAQQAQSGFEVLCGRPVIVSSGGVLSPSAALFTGGRTGSGGSPAGPGTATDGTEPGVDASGAIVPDAAIAQANARGLKSGEISSWRLVSLHNGAYVELTIAW